ncbi:helix-turn-helix domain-containing protein [Streptomyces sp. NPDC058664]|uniref:helix-turn-helix domain-containing protein n=1 Tax=unclassified Streptomyces TaxID=2593676 RepID=UPI00365EAA0A
MTRPTSERCAHGHPYPENLVVDARGWTSCRECRRMAYRRWYHAHYVPAAPDEIAVERVVLGDPPPRLTPSERAAAIRRLDARGLSARQIAEQTRCTPRTVHRIRSRIRTAA